MNFCYSIFITQYYGTCTNVDAFENGILMQTMLLSQIGNELKMIIPKVKLCFLILFGI